MQNMSFSCLKRNPPFFLTLTVSLLLIFWQNNAKSNPNNLHINNTGYWSVSSHTITDEETFRGGIVLYRTQGTRDRQSENFIHFINRQLDLIDTTSTGHRMLNNIAFGNNTSADGHTLGVFDRRHFTSDIPLLNNVMVGAVTLPAGAALESQHRENIRPNSSVGVGSHSFVILSGTRFSTPTSLLAHELSHAHAFQNGTAVPPTYGHQYPHEEISYTIGNMLEEMENIGLIYNPNRGGISENAILAELQQGATSLLSRWTYAQKTSYLDSPEIFIRKFRRHWPQGYEYWYDAARLHNPSNLFETPSCSDYLKRLFNPFNRGPDDDNGNGGGFGPIGGGIR